MLFKKISKRRFIIFLSLLLQIIKLLIHKINMHSASKALIAINLLSNNNLTTVLSLLKYNIINIEIVVSMVAM